MKGGRGPDSTQRRGTYKGERKSDRSTSFTDTEQIRERNRSFLAVHSTRDNGDTEMVNVDKETTPQGHRYNSGWYDENRSETTACKETREDFSRVGKLMKSEGDSHLSLPANRQFHGTQEHSVLLTKIV